MGFADFAADVAAGATLNATGFLEDFGGLIALVFSLAVLSLLLRVVFMFLPR